MATSCCVIVHDVWCFRVTLADGSQYLIHKGSNYGISSQTVVVDGSHMSDKWKVKFSA